MTLTVDREVIRNPEGMIEFWKRDEKSREHYHIGIRLKGDDDELNLIKRVEYLLHPSFKNNLRVSTDRGNNFSITKWTWGFFSIAVTVFYKDGSKKRITYSLSYDLPDDDGSNYIQVR